MTKLRAALLATAVLTLAATASAGPKDAEIEALIDKAVAEHSVVANCSALSKKYLEATLSFWERDRKEAVMPALVKLGVAPEVFVRLVQKTATENLMLKTKGKAGELIAYCRENADEIARQYSNAGINLPHELEKLLK